MRSLIRDYQGKSYGLENGYVGFMHGQFMLEKEQGKVYFIIIENWRSYDKGRDETRTERYKFLWQGGELKLIDADIS